MRPKLPECALSKADVERVRTQMLNVVSQLDNFREFWVEVMGPAMMTGLFYGQVKNSSAWPRSSGRTSEPRPRQEIKVCP